MVLKDWNIEAETGYVPQTTFYMDFSVADAFGAKAIKDTYNRAFKSWKEDYVFLTELVMALNWKSWEHAESNLEYCKLYIDLFEKAYSYATENLKGEELNYFYRTTD